MSSFVPILLCLVIGFASSNIVELGSKYVIWTIGTIVGLLWGFILIHILKIFANKATATILLYLSTATMAILFGGSLFGMLMNAALDPVDILRMMKPPVGGGILFFVIFNSLLEMILLQATLFTCNKFSTKQVQYCLYGAIFPFFSARVWTYFYFVPTIFRFTQLPVYDALPAPLNAEIMTWVNLSWIRCFIDGTSTLCLFLAVYYHSSVVEVVGHTTATTRQKKSK